jgi:hypothetical protein
MPRRPQGPLERKRKEVLDRLGLTQQDLADLWDVRQSFVSALLSGTNRSWEKELEFCRLAGLPHTELFAEHPNHPRTGPRATGAAPTFAAPGAPTVPLAEEPSRD